MNNITFIKEKVNIDTIKNDKIVKLPWVPKFGAKLRKEFAIRTIFTSGRNLKNLIYRNKLKLLPNAVYIVETKKKIITRTIEHQETFFKRKWKSSGATEHCIECHGQSGPPHSLSH